MELNMPAGQTSGLHVHDSEREDCSSASQAERLYLATNQASQATAVESRAEVKDFGFQQLNRIRDEAVETRDNVDKMGLAGQVLSQKVGDVVVDKVEKFGLYNVDKTEKFGLNNLVTSKDGFKEVLLEGCKNTDEVNDNVSGQAKDIQMQACRDTASIISNDDRGFRDSLLQAANNTAAIQLQNTLNAKDAQISAVGNAKDAALVATLNAKDAEISAVTNAKDALINANQNATMLSKQMCDMAKDVALTAAINAKDAELSAVRNAAAIAKQLAECCCKQEMLVVEQGNKTRDLILAQREQDLRDARQREHEELVALRLRSSLLPPPVAAVSL